MDEENKKVEETKTDEATHQKEGETKVDEKKSDVDVEKLQEQMKKMEYTIVKLKKEKKAEKDSDEESEKEEKAQDVDADSISAIAEKAAQKIIYQNQKESILSSMGDELKESVEDLLDNTIKSSGNIQNDIAIAVSILKAQENSAVLDEIKRYSENKKTIDSSGDIDDSQDGEPILSGQAKVFAEKAKAFKEANGIG